MQTGVAFPTDTAFLQMLAFWMQKPMRTPACEGMELQLALSGPLRTEAYPKSLAGSCLQPCSSSLTSPRSAA